MRSAQLGQVAIADKTIEVTKYEYDIVLEIWQWCLGLEMRDIFVMIL